VQPVHDPDWRCIGYRSGGQPFIIDGVDVIRYQWRPTGVEVTVKDLHDPIFLSIPVYEVVAEGKRIIFASGQFRWDTDTFFVPVDRTPS
jgi:hypothetical protein